jgi:hypothetical protein
VTVNLLSVKVITDYHLEEFTRSPYWFYHRYMLKNRTRSHWMQMVQYSVNRIVHDFYKFPPKSRSSLKVLELIQQYWIKQVNLFDSKIHYYTVLAKITDHLLQVLLSEQDMNPPLFLFEKVDTWHEELQVHLSITFQMATWTKGSFVIKKYVVDDDPGVVTSFNHLAILFSKTAFQTLPERIETVSLLSGITHQIYPNTDDISKALDYCELMKKLLEESKNSPEDSMKKCNRCRCKNQSWGPLIPKIKEKLYM